MKSTGAAEKSENTNSKQERGVYEHLLGKGRDNIPEQGTERDPREHKQENPTSRQTSKGQKKPESTKGVHGWGCYTEKVERGFKKKFSLRTDRLKRVVEK